MALAREQLETARLQEEAGRIKHRFEETRFRIEQLSVESAVSGRLEVISEDELTPSPINRSKRVALATTGFGGCLILGVLVGVWSGFRRPAPATDDQPADVSR